MQTAAGVAAGALAFEGVESVLHGLGGGGFGMGPGVGMMGGGFGRPAEETVINNYYDQPGGQGGFEQGGEHHFHESADQGGAQLSDASYNTSGDDRGFDNGGQDDSAGFDGGGFDDGGGFGGDSGGGDLL
jgi:hypothetical protein